MITEQALLDVFEGRTDPNDFFRQTNSDWHRLAEWTFKRWRIPSWFTLEEFAQEIRMYAWEYIWTYDPTYGTSIKTHVIYETMRRGEKRIHKTRNVNRHRNASYQPTFFLEMPSAMPGSKTGEVFEIEGQEDITPEIIAEAQLALERALAQCTSDVETEVVRMMAESADFRDSENVSRRVAFLNQFANRPKGCRKKFKAA